VARIFNEIETLLAPDVARSESARWPERRIESRFGQYFGGRWKVNVRGTDLTTEPGSRRREARLLSYQAWENYRRRC